MGTTTRTRTKPGVPDITTMKLGATPAVTPPRPSRASGDAATGETVYVIEHGIPIPPRSNGQRHEGSYPFAAMQPGDSFLLPGPTATAGKRASAAASGANKRFAPRRFESRRVAEGARIWRVK